MVISKTTYVRDLSLAQEKTSPADKRFLLKKYLESLKTSGHVSCWLNDVDSQFEKRLLNSAITRITQTDVECPNTIVTVALPEDGGHLRGEIDIKYNRVSIAEYFSIDKLRLGKKDPIVIDYDDWLDAISNGKGALNGLIHRALSYRFGRTFSQDGVIVRSIGSDIMRGVKPLALIIPSQQEIEEGWKMARNITQQKHGSTMYDILHVGLRFISSDHMFIEDSEAVIRIRLRRLPVFYNRSIVEA